MRGKKFPTYAITPPLDTGGRNDQNTSLLLVSGARTGTKPNRLISDMYLSSRIGNTSLRPQRQRNLPTRQ